MRFTAVSTSLLVLCSGSTALAHIVLDEPVAREAAMKDGPCGGTLGPSTDPSHITELAPGERITVTWRETVAHAGYFRIAFSTDAVSFPDDPPASPPPASYPILSIIPKVGGQTSYSAEITLPDIECNPCALQLIQYMEGSAAPYYYQCADLVLARDALGSAGSAGAGGGSGGIDSGAGGDPVGGAPGSSGGAAGTSSGGSISSGGMSPTLGGNGGSVPLGGSAGGLALGGAAAGGAFAGGAPAAGGVTVTGGALTTEAGGSVATGGSVITGGSVATGGTPTTAGAPGVDRTLPAGGSTGVMPGTGGQANAPAGADDEDDGGCSVAGGPRAGGSALVALAAALSMTLLSTRRRARRAAARASRFPD